MGRVGHHHVSLRHFGHHAAARQLALLTANARLEVWIALAFPSFPLQFLVGHLQPVMVLPELKRNIDCGDKSNACNEADKAVKQNLNKGNQRGFNRLTEQGKQAVLLVLDHPVQNTANQQRLEHRLDQFGHALP